MLTMSRNYTMKVLDVSVQRVPECLIIARRWKWLRGRHCVNESGALGIDGLKIYGLHNGTRLLVTCMSYKAAQA